MAREGKSISFRINLSKLDPKHYWVNPETKEIFGDFRMTLYEEDRKTTYNGKEYTDNGFVSQQLNEETRKKEKELPKEKKTNTPILGNVKLWKKAGDISSMPGYTGTETGGGVPGVSGSVPGLSGPVTGGDVPKEVLPF